MYSELEAVILCGISALIGFVIGQMAEHTYHLRRGELIEKEDE